MDKNKKKSKRENDSIAWWLRHPCGRWEIQGSVSLLQLRVLSSHLWYYSLELKEPPECAGAMVMVQFRLLTFSREELSGGGMMSILFFITKFFMGHCILVPRKEGELFVFVFSKEGSIYFLYLFFI